ncbi:sugar ABC transporter permease [Actinospica sp. MGRD01-02]|uniref:Sugar ABC transporter permease n=1 Tax=Actinospica acidithermotolerans TaxID=2828514 RepID=A0A941ING3_9ACTN|nr:sugar ABC transporter permease [Actinospica acidithermotolerans]MBR7830998.1 sugar ABC transporter permease [Actinospica acidithermotolerans]
MTVVDTRGPRETRAADGASRRPRRGAMRRSAARLGWGFASPALLLVFAVMIFPIGFSIAMSFSNVNVTGSGFQLNGFTGNNYSILFHSARYIHDLEFTAIYTVVTVTVEMILGTLIALVLERLTHARAWLMALLLLPWALITVVSAQLWSYIYNGVYGVFDAIMNAVGVHNLNVLGTPTQAAVAMGVADVWKTTPFVAIMVLAGLVMLPGEVVEAARIDGANGWQTFWKVRLPLLRPALAVAVMFRILQAFGLFDLPYVLTGGGPGTSTESLALLGYKVLFNDVLFGPGAAIAASTAFIVLVVCLLFLKVFRTQVGEQED